MVTPRRAWRLAVLVGAVLAFASAPAAAQLERPTVPAGTAGKAAFDAGIALLWDGKAEAAERQFERAVAAGDRVALYHLWLANAVGQQASSASPVRQPFMARRIKAAFERAVALDPDLLDARDGLISFYMQAPGFMGGSEAKAREQQREIARRSAYRGHIAASNIAAVRKDTAGVERALRAAITAAPDSVRPVISLAQRQQAVGRVADAFATLEAALARQPDEVAYQFQVGRLAAISGQQLARGEAVLRALVAAPDWPVRNSRPSRAAVHYRLGMLLERSGRKPEARANYERAIALDPTLQPAKDALAALR